MKKMGLLLALFVLASVAGCSSIPLMVVKQVPTREPISLPEGTLSKPIGLKKVRIKLPRNTFIGTLQYNVNCDVWGDFADTGYRWVSGQRKDITSDDFTDVFLDEMRKSNFKVVGDPSSLFKQDQSLQSAEILLGAVITEIAGNYCRKVGWDDRPIPGFNGESYLKIKWVVYSVIDRRVVYEKITEGYYREPKETPEATQITIMLESFAAALTNLLADEEFTRVASTPAGATVALPAKDRGIKIDTRGIEVRKLPEGLEYVRSAVVTVYTATGHGSGFFISPKGFMLTNHHVVGGSKYVTVGLHSGRKVVAEIIMTSPRHDIALLKVGEAGLPALRLETKEAPVGTDVYAIGSPHTAKLHSTVTKGIVSSYRGEKGLRSIQSDVAIFGGNSGGPMLNPAGKVVGVVASQMRSGGGGPTGQNFMIPSRVVIEALKLKFPHGK